MKDTILSHYRKEEYAFVEKVIGWAEGVINTYQPYRTDFVDLRQLEIIKNIVNSHVDLAMFFTGGYDNAERVRVFIAPDYWQFEENEMGLAFFQINGDNKFNQLTHRDYLGAFLNLGIKREKFGDLLISESDKQIILAEEIATFVQFELKQVGKTKVELTSILKDDLKPPTTRYDEINLTVSSLRVDTISGHAFRLSRSKIAEYIKGRNLKVNWQIVDKVDYPLAPGDLVSLRGFGRYKFLEEEGNTKKGRFRVKIGKVI